MWLAYSAPCTGGPVALSDLWRLPFGVGRLLGALQRRACSLATPPVPRVYQRPAGLGSGCLEKSAEALRTALSGRARTHLMHGGWPL